MTVRDQMNALVKKRKASQDRTLSIESRMGDLQDSCQHTWQLKSLRNSFHADLWDLTWKCSQCDTQRIDEKVPPVCTDCHMQLLRADDPRDTEAEMERTKPEHKRHYNPPEAWRCSNCGKIHILHVLGD